MANNKDFEKDFKLPDTKALSEAYTEYLDSVTFGGKPIGEEKKKLEAVSMAKVDETEKSSTVHDEIVEKIVRKNKGSQPQHLDGRACFEAKEKRMAKY